VVVEVVRVFLEVAVVRRLAVVVDVMRRLAVVVDVVRGGMHDSSIQRSVDSVCIAKHE
jgi:phosphosulfolactate phosphohydrolase-like enzyme